MIKTIIPQRSASSLIALLLSSVVGFANDISNHTAETNDRFKNDASFIASSYDLSGIGRTTDGNWATRIGDNYFLSANHFHPGTGESVTFHSSNDPSGPSYTYATAGGSVIAGTDIWLGYFNESIDSSIKTYSYSTTSANSLADTGISGANVLMFGNSITSDSAYGGPGKLTDMAVAENQAESWFEEGTTGIVAAGVTNNFASPAGWDQIVTFKDESADTAYNFQTYEGQLQSGDSGSPLLSFAGSELIVQGIAYAIVTQNGGLTGNFIDTVGPSPAPDAFEQRPASLYSYVGSYETELNTVIANVPTPIPEPSVFSALLLGAGSILLRRKRS